MPLVKAAMHIGNDDDDGRLELRLKHKESS